jgi:glyoxylase-like metal-dependent hydrolase (beta-lactamase superfamily II)
MDVIKTTLNGIDIFQVIELEIGQEVQGTLGHAAIPDEVAKIKWLFPTYVGPDGVFKSIVQAFVLAIGNRVVVVDTCIGNDKDRKIELPRWDNLQTDFKTKFEQTGFTPDDVTDVLCTHMHMDHVGWNTTLVDRKWMPTFRNARHYFAQSEYDYWLTDPVEAGPGNHLSFKDSVLPIIEAGMAHFVPDTADLGDGISLVPTPGHTPGHVSIRIQTGAGDVYVTGDSIHHPCQLAHTHWTASIDQSPSDAIQSRRRLLELTRATNAYLAGSHFAVPSIGRVVHAADCEVGEFVFRPISTA